MVISGITYYPYELKLKTSFTTAKTAMPTREGFIIEIKDQSGNAGIGESAPLPEFGTETLDICLKGILRFITEYPEEIIDLKDIVSALHHYNNTPSARHGLEQALLNLLSAATGDSLYKLLNQNLNPEVKVNSVMGFLQPDQCAHVASRMVEEGYDTIKMKVGRQWFQHDIDAVEAVRGAVGYDINLRLDANGMWEYKEAIGNIKELEKYKPEYIEQPCMGKEDLIRLAFETEVKIAADESIRSVSSLDTFIRNRYCSVLVIKPMLIGSIIETAKLISSAENNNIKVVISSAFESSVGFRSSLFLASIVQDKHAHGLSTMNFFTRDLYDNPFKIEQGKINITDAAVMSKI